jgi:hypothetical protein
MPELQTFDLSTPEKNNFLSLDELARGDHNRVWLGPGDFVDGDGHILNSGHAASVLLLEASAAAEVGATFKRPTLWRRGYFIVTLYWSTTSAAGNTLIDLYVYGLTDGDNVFGGGTALKSDTAERLTTIGANKLEVDVFPETGTLLTGDYVLITVVINRDGTHVSDTSTGNMRVHGVDFEFKPQTRR